MWQLLHAPLALALIEAELGHRLAFTRSGGFKAVPVQKFPFCAVTSAIDLPVASTIEMVAPAAAAPLALYSVPAAVHSGAPPVPVWQLRQLAPALWCPLLGGVAG